MVGVVFDGLENTCVWMVWTYSWYCPIIFQVKFEVFPVYGMKSCGSRDIVPLIIENISRWRWVRCFGRKSPRYPLNRKASGPFSWFGRFVDDENLLPLPRVEPRLHANPARNLVTTDYAVSTPVFHVAWKMSWKSSVCEAGFEVGT
jgi:hypothetical protein